MLAVCFTLATGLDRAPPPGATAPNPTTSSACCSATGGGCLPTNFSPWPTFIFTAAIIRPSSTSVPRRRQKEIVAEPATATPTARRTKRTRTFSANRRTGLTRFGRHFRITEHTHLEHGNEREILPWLRLAADMDPQKIETYTVGAFFLREHLNQPREAEAFLREGLRNNPDSCEILFELGRLYNENYHDPDRARNVWQLAVKKFMNGRSPRPQRKTRSSLRKSPLTSPISKKMPATTRRPSTGFKPRKKFRPTRTRCKSRLTKSKRKWLARQCPVAAP
jgi:hypothetical protein